MNRLDTSNLITKIGNYLKVKLPGMGGLYVLFMLGLVSGLSYLMTGGVVPDIERNPENPEVVEIDDRLNSESRQNLQLVNIGIKPTDTPTPTPENTPTPTIPGVTPSPTTTVEECYNNTVVNVLVDLSASMGNSGKYDELKRALSYFEDELGNYDEAVIGMQAFGAPGIGTTNGFQGVREYERINTVNSDSFRIVDRLPATSSGLASGGTYMRNGFEVAMIKIREAKQRFSDGEYQYIAILFSDGVPEVLNPTACLTTVQYNGETLCFSKQQDPRATPFSLSSRNLTTEMKGITDEVYVVGIYDSTVGRRGYQFTDELITLLKTISTTGNAPYYQFIDLNSSSSNRIQPAFANIFRDICE